jgi:hypothetical protein
VRARGSKWQNYLEFRIAVGQGAGFRDPVQTGCGSERVKERVKAMSASVEAGVRKEIHPVLL